MINGQINSLSEIDVETATFDDIRGYGGTFIVNSSGTGRYKTYSSRNGVTTKLGDIEKTVWRQLVEMVIARENEEWLLTALCEWEKAHNYTKNSPSELRCKALQLHSARIFDNLQWVYYIPINRQYRPDELKKARIVTVICDCCKQPGEKTQEQIDAAYKGAVACPTCGRWSPFKILHKRESEPDPCLCCDCNDPDVGCTMPSIDRS